MSSSREGSPDPNISQQLEGIGDVYDRIGELFDGVLGKSLPYSKKVT